jgi:hypothetical protein
MIARLRRRHRWMVTSLFLLVVALYVWAIVARKATPRVALPPGAEHKPRGTETVIP